MTGPSGTRGAADEPGHVVIINRYSAAFARYAGYIDHERLVVSYVSRTDVAGMVPAGTRDVIPVNTSGHLISTAGDCRQIEEAVAELAARHGTPTALIALFEGDLDVAARLREVYNIPGDRPAHIAPFRDKLLMHERAVASEVRTPFTEQLTDLRSLLDFGTAQGWPVIVKPRYGTGSTGVQRIDSADEAARLRLERDEDAIMQPFVAGQILHADGVYDGRKLVTWRLSRYIGDCLSYNSNAPLASYELDDTELATKVGDLLERLLPSIAARPVVFHAEVIEEHDGSLSFLEIAGRPGGAEVHRVWREVHGVDLLALHARLQMGMDLPSATAGHGLSARGERAGWLLIQPSVARPCIVETVVAAPEGAAYAQDVPAVGHLIHSGGGYSHAARFRFRGSTSAMVRESIAAVAERFRLQCRTVPQDRLIVIGSAPQAHGEPALQSLTPLARISLFDREQPTWQSVYCDTVDQFDDAQSLTAAIKARLTELDDPGRVGLLTLDESLTEEAASAAASLGLPSIGLRAAQQGEWAPS